jgi:hypothetical protein
MHAKPDTPYNALLPVFSAPSFLPSCCLTCRCDKTQFRAHALIVDQPINPEEMGMQTE